MASESASLGGDSPETPLWEDPALLEHLENVSGALSPASAGESDRGTLLCQREAFESLRRKFQAAQAAKATGQDEAEAGQDASPERGQIQQLSGEIRRLQRENAHCKTDVLTAQEEAIERAAEVDTLGHQLSRAQAEIEDLKHRHRQEVSRLREESDEALATLRHQSEDIRKLNVRLQDAEDNSAVSRSQAKQVEAMHTERRHECEQLLVALHAREGELHDVRRQLHSLRSTLVPAEEVRAWRSRAEELEHQYNQAVRCNEELTSAIDSQQGDLTQRHELAKRKDREIKMIELEKHELQMQLENVQSAANYFQSKYKAAMTVQRPP